MIGGEIVCECAQAMSLPNRFLPAGVESLRNAPEAASRMSYVIDFKKQNLSEMDTMLNNTFSGIIQVDLSGTIQRVNRAASLLLNKESAELVGHKATESGDSGFAGAQGGYSRLAGPLHGGVSGKI